MLKTIKGAIFDVDDTLLDNKPGIPGEGLHERSRLTAVHAVGKRYKLKSLESVTVEQNYRAFRDAPIHSVESAVWSLMQQAGIADSDAINPNHKILLEIVACKNALHKKILLEDGEPLPDAVEFVKALADNGLADKLAIGSTAIRPEIDAFLKKTGLDKYFPSNRIKSKELITHPKPHPEIFNLAFASLGLPEIDRPMVYTFEDDPRGIMSAKAAGLYTCAITTRHDKESLLALTVPPDLVADSFAEFADLLGVVL